jgi:hypothetical protein
MKQYEICVYQYGTRENGDHEHIDGFTYADPPVDPPVETGWTVYVREYVYNDEWNEVYDEDFHTEEARDQAVLELRIKYPDASEDWY